MIVLLAVLLAARPEDGGAAAPPVTAVVFSPDGTSVIAGSQEGVRVLTWPNLAPAGEIATNLAHVHDLTFSADGKRLLAAGGSPAEDGGVEIWSWPECSLERRTTFHDDVVVHVAWIEGKGEWVSAGLDGQLLLCSLSSDEPVRAYAGNARGVMDVVDWPDSDLLIAAGVDQTLRVWQKGAAEPIRALDNHTAPVVDLCVRPQGQPRLVASASDDKTVRFWQPQPGRLVRFARLESRPLAIEWLPDGRWLAAACADGHVRFIDPATAKIKAEVQAVPEWAWSLAVSPATGDLIVGGPSGKIVPVDLPASLAAGEK
jgi:WD40 repeat protein